MGPADRRRAYLTCITTAHLVDHVMVTLPRRPDGKLDIRAVCSAISATGLGGTVALEIVEALCNGTKHAQPDPKPSRPIKLAPGYERLVPAFSLGVEGVGLGKGRLDAPGLVVDHGGAHHFIDDCVRAMVRACSAAFSDRSADVDLGKVARGADRYGFLDALLPPSGVP